MGKLFRMQNRVSPCRPSPPSVHPSLNVLYIYVYFNLSFILIAAIYVTPDTVRISEWPYDYCCDRHIVSNYGFNRINSNTEHHYSLNVAAQEHMYSTYGGNRNSLRSLEHVGILSGEVVYDVPFNPDYDEAAQGPAR